MQKIRVAFCIAEMLVGGAEKALAWLTVRLDRNRFEPVVYVLRSRKFHEARPNYLSILEDNAIPVHFLDVKGICSLPRALVRFCSGLRRQKADILLSFMFHANILGRIAARHAGVSIVLSGIRVSEMEHKIHILIDRLTSKRVDRFICVSKSSADFTEKVGKIPASKITVIPNGVTTVPLIPVENLIPPLFSNTQYRKLLFVGRLARQKGLDWLLLNAEKWLGTGQGKGWALWLVGDGPQKEELQQIVSRLPADAASRIYFAGWRPDVPYFLPESDILLLPSRYEGMPNILLEASLAGLPVLSSHCDGADEILGEYREPQTFSFGDRQEFQEKITRLMNDAKLRRELGEKNRTRAQENFSIEKMTASYETLFETLYFSPAKRIS